MFLTNKRILIWVIFLILVIVVKLTIGVFGIVHLNTQIIIFVNLIIMTNIGVVVDLRRKFRNIVIILVGIIVD